MNILEIIIRLSIAIFVILLILFGMMFLTIRGRISNQYENMTEIEISVLKRRLKKLQNEFKIILNEKGAAVEHGFLLILIIAVILTVIAYFGEVVKMIFESVSNITKIG